MYPFVDGELNVIFFFLLTLPLPREVIFLDDSLCTDDGVLQIINRSKSGNILAMKMKIPNNGSGNGYYGHDTGIISYVDNNIDTEAEVQATGDGDFSEYLWMENEEEFDKQVLDTRGS